MTPAFVLSLLVGWSLGCFAVVIYFWLDEWRYNRRRKAAAERAKRRAAELYAPEAERAHFPGQMTWIDPKPGCSTLIDR